MSPGDIDYIIQNQDFIQHHALDNPFELGLKHGADPQKKLLIGQIQARQKIKKKMPEWAAHLNVVFPPGLSLEQASSEATAKLKARLVSGISLLDITGGLGVDCFYLSQSFETTTYVDQSEELCRLATHNFKVLEAPIPTLCRDGTEVLKTSAADVVYVDPYRRDDAKNKVVALEDCKPDVTLLLHELTKSNRTAMIKTSPMLDIAQGMEKLRLVREVWVISHKNDCKEVVFLLQNQVADPVIKTFDIQADTIKAFEFNWLNKHTQATTGVLEQYIYEPNASVMKSGGQDLLALDFELKKLHRNSNIFTSSQLQSSFPGRIFKVKQEMKAMDKSLRKGRFNVISRNFPKKASEIEKQLQLKPSQNDYIVATRLIDGSYAFIVGEVVGTAQST